MNRTLIMKFGGSTVGTPAALTQVLSIVLHEKQHWEQLILVASALDGVTDALLEAAHLAQLANRRGYRRITTMLRTRHMALCEHLPLGQQERHALQADLDRLLFEMLDLCQTVADTPSDTLLPQVSDSIIGVGERLSARIIAALLRQNHLRGVAIDATDIIITDDTFSNATVLIPQTRERIDMYLMPMLNRQIIPVITGFIGATLNGQPTTLGRGGSDYTASILSQCIGADELWVWADVDGMMTADPREISEARVIPELSYDEVAELAYFGARILHNRMIAPLRDKQIPLRIRNIYKPQGTGTLIRQKMHEPQPHIKAVTSIYGVALMAAYSGSLASVISLVDKTLYDRIGSHADVMISSQSSSRSFLCFIIPTTAGFDAVASVRATLSDQLRYLPTMPEWVVEQVGVLTVIGADIDQHAGLIGQTLVALEGIRIKAVSLGPSHCSFSIVVDVQDSEKALRKLHPLTLIAT